MFQVIFNEISAAEISQLPTLEQLEVLNEFQVKPEDLEGIEDNPAGAKFGQIERDGKKLYRYRASDVRIYFEVSKDHQSVIVHRVLSKNSFQDFFSVPSCPSATMTLSRSRSSSGRSSRRGNGRGKCEGPPFPGPRCPVDAGDFPVESVSVTDLDSILDDEALRREAFPSCRDRIFLAHAAVAPIPQAAVEAMDAFNRASATGELDYGEVFLKRMDRIRGAAARLFGGARTNSPSSVRPVSGSASSRTDSIGLRATRS